MPTSNRGGAAAPQRQRAVAQLLAKANTSRTQARATQAQAQRQYAPKPTLHQKAQQAITHAKNVAADPTSTRDEKAAAAAAAYHAVRATKDPKLLEANVVPAHGVERIVGQTLLDLSDAAIHSPGGAYATGRAVAHDVGQAAHGNLSFKQSRGIAKAMAKGTLEDFQHPLRHPGFTALDAFTLASAGAGTAARVGEVGRAVRAGELGAAAKAAVRGPLPGTRTYEHNGLGVPTPNSKNALVRAGQKAHARTVNRGENVGRQARIAGKHLHEQQRALNAPERAQSEALAARGRKLSTPQETALRVVHEGAPIDERIRFHEQQMTAAGRGTQRFIDHRQKALLLHAAKKYVHDVNGRPELRPEFKRLGEVSGRVEKVNAEREAILGDAGTGDVTGQQMEHRVNAPGRVVRGAHYEKPTAAKRGVPSPQLERQRSYVARLEQLHERALERAGRKGKPYPPVKVDVPGVDKTISREMTVEEAAARLKALDKKYNAAAKKIEPIVAPEFQGKMPTETLASKTSERSMKQWEQGRRNVIAGKTKLKPQTVNEEIAARIDERLHQLAKKHPEQQFAKDIAEREALQKALHERLPGEVAQLPKVTETVKGEPGVKHVPSDIPTPNVLSNPVATRLGGALSVARDRLATMEKAAAKRRKPIGIVGHEDFAAGRSRIPYTSQTGKMTGRTSAYRGGVPRKPGSVTHEFTGGLLRSGNFRDKTSRLVAESGIEAQRYADVLRLRDHALKASVPVDSVPEGERSGYIAIRVGSAPKPPELKALEAKIEEGVKLTRDEKQILGDRFDNWKQQMFAEPSAVGDAKGYRLVRKELLGKINQPRLLSNVAHYRALRGAGHVVSETNNAVRTALLYLAPKYAIPNIGGNVLLNVSQQGFRAIPNFYRTLTVVDRDPDLAAKFRSAMGEGFVRQLEPTSGISRRLSEPLAQKWSKLVDEKFRESALLDELRTLGFKSRDQLHSAFNDPANHGKLVEAIQRANDAIGDYERLNPVEKDVIRHAVFFYTWLKVSARLSKTYLVDRPIQSSAVVGLGRLGEQRQQQELGSVPSYMEPLFKVAGSKKHPIVSNASALNVFTAADMTKAIINLAKGEHNQSGYQIADNLSPFFGLAVAAVTGRDPFTQQPVKGNLGQLALRQLTGGLPQTALKQRIARSKTDQSSKAYSYTRNQALGQFGLGPLGPHGLNPAPTHELAAKEHLADLSPAERSRATVFQRRQNWFGEMKRLNLLDHGRLPKPLRDAFNIEASRQAAYTGATHRANAKPGTAAYHLARFEVDAHLLAKYHQISEAEAQQMLAWAQKNQHNIDALKKARAYVSRHYYQSSNGFLTLLGESRKYLAAHGAKNLG